MTPSVALVVPSYNGARFLEECLDSVATLDYPKERLETIVVDNASTDGTLELLATRYPWVRVLPQRENTGFAAAIIFAGFRPHVPRVMAGLDIAVLPSLHEGMPLTAIESAAMGIPVIATAVDGTPEVVQHERTGLLVPAQDSAALTDAIRRLFRDPDFARKLGTTAREVALDSFDVERQVQRTAQLYLAAVSG